MAAGSTERRAMFRRCRLPASWFVAVVLAQVVVQVAVTIARPATSYRLVSLGFDATAVGIVAAAFAILPMLLAVPFGRLTEKASAQMVLVGGLFTAVAALSLATTELLKGLVAATALLGIGHLAVVVATQSLVARRSPRARRASMFGTMTAAASIGQLIGPLLGGALIQADSSAPTAASTSLRLHAAAAFAFLAMPATILLHSRRDTAIDDTPRSESAPALTVLRVLTTPGMRAALASSFASKGTSDLLLAYLPLLGLQLGLSAVQVGALLSLSAGTGILARFVTAPLLAVTGPRRLVVAMTGFSAVVAGSMPWLGGGWSLAIAMGSLGFMLALVQTISMVWVVSVVPGGSQGTALGVRLAINRVGQSAAPALAAGTASLFGFSAIFAMLSIILVAASALTLATRNLTDWQNE